MKIVGICASHRKGGSSYRLLEEAMKGVKEVNPTAETKIIELAKLKINPCIATCPEGCARETFECAIKDGLQTVFDEMRSADGILIASPRYFIVPSKLQALMERTYCVNYCIKYDNPEAIHPLTNKPIGFLTVSASGGYSTIPLLEHLEKFALWLNMKPIMTKTFLFRGVVAKDPAEKDSQALQRAKTLGQTIAKAI
ncbi:MAG: flavodoxin family protein [Thermoproteota archaeon]|nr:flavodoxin family protein [Thermoproteota archaeon]